MAKSRYDFRMASGDEAARLQALKKELRTIADRLETLGDELVFSPGVVARLPKEYRAKSTWVGFENAPRHAQKAATAVRTIASELDMAINLAEIADH
jgi:hypothetical protein